MKDEKLIRRIKSGDLGTLDALIRKYYNDIYTYCCRRLGNRQNAQDVTQEVFLRFCRNFYGYTQQGKCKNYLYIIAHNLCINEGKRKRPLFLEDTGRGEPPGEDAPEVRLETSDAVQNALNQLPEEQKEVVLLRFYQGLKLREIARITDSKLSVTKYRLSRGLSTLGRLLPKEDWL